jgi:hypothetical protein
LLLRSSIPEVFVIGRQHGMTMRAAASHAAADSNSYLVLVTFWLRNGLAQDLKFGQTGPL